MVHPRPNPTKQQGAGARPEWYVSGSQVLREGIRLLDKKKQEFLCHARDA